MHARQKSENRDAYCNEAHKMSLIEKIFNKLSVYRIINIVLKRKENIIDVRKLL